MKIKFLILANSYKDNGRRCVAGINLENKKLIRLVPRIPPYSIPKEQVLELKPLNVIETEISDNPATADGAQSENYYVGLPFHYNLIGKLDLKEFHDLIKETRKNIPKKFYFYPFDSTNAIINYGEYSHKNYSIDVIRAYDVKLKRVLNNDGKTKTHASFDVIYGKNIRKSLCDFRVTDPATSLFEDYSRPTNYQKAYLVVTIPTKPDEISGLYYKFIAAIIPYF